jgi:acyl-coenzyme A thioesterase PaaI-like protein
MESLQDVCLPGGTCFGCGPANPDGIRIKSHWSTDGRFVVAEVVPEPRFTSGYPGIMYGGAVASLIDCHSAWTAAAFGYRAEGREPGSEPAVTVMTASLTVRYLAPTPLDETLSLQGWVEGDPGRTTRVRCEIRTASKVTAEGDSLFVRVDPSLAEGGTSTS